MKTMHKVYSLFIVLLVFIAVSSCSKKDYAPPQPTIAELLAHKWFFSMRDNSGTLTLANACSEQTYFDFKPDGTLIFQEFDYDSSQTCLYGPPEVYQYTLSADETQIMSTWGSGTTLTLTIISINTTTLELDFSSGDIYTFKR